MKNDDILTVKDVSEYLNIGINQAYALIKRKGFPVIRIGNSYRVYKDELDKYLKSFNGAKIKL